MKPNTGLRTPKFEQVFTEKCSALQREPITTVSHAYSTTLKDKYEVGKCVLEKMCYDHHE